jgi:hypothetical protein
VPRIGVGWYVIGRGELVAHVEFDFARQLDNCFGVMAVFGKRVFDGLRAAEEQAAIKTVLLLCNPVAAAVLADKDDSRCGVARWRFVELPVDIPCADDGVRSGSRGPLRCFRM